MEGKVFDGVISFLEEMKFKKRLFPDKPLERRKKTILTNSLPKQLRSNSGEMKMKS